MCVCDLFSSQSPSLHNSVDLMLWFNAEKGVWVWLLNYHSSSPLRRRHQYVELVIVIVLLYSWIELYSAYTPLHYWNQPPAHQLSCEILQRDHYWKHQKYTFFIGLLGALSATHPLTTLMMASWTFLLFAEKGVWLVNITAVNITLKTFSAPSANPVIVKNRF